MAKHKKSHNILNRRARFDYELFDSYNAGVELFGHEVKSVRTGNADLSGAYVDIAKGEAWLIGSYIAPYSYSNLSESYDPLRTRRLLLKKSEIEKLAIAKQQKYTIVATKISTRSHYIKVEIRTARGKKLHDKRHTIKKRDLERESSRKF